MCVAGCCCVLLWEVCGAVQCVLGVRLGWVKACAVRGRARGCWAGGHVLPVLPVVLPVCECSVSVLVCVVLCVLLCSVVLCCALLCSGVCFVALLCVVVP
jgi:hypothetical protein